MTPIETIKAIDKAWWHLPEAERDVIKRTHEKTWLMTTLWNEGLMTPTRAARNRLSNLLLAVHAAGKRLGIAYFGPDATTAQGQAEVLRGIK